MPLPREHPASMSVTKSNRPLIVGTANTVKRDRKTLPKTDWIACTDSSARRATRYNYTQRRPQRIGYSRINMIYPPEGRMMPTHHGIAGTNQRPMHMSEDVRNHRLSMVHTLSLMHFHHGWRSQVPASKLLEKLGRTHCALNIAS